MNFFMYSIKVESSPNKSYRYKQDLFMYSMKLNPLFKAILESKKNLESKELLESKKFLESKKILESEKYKYICNNILKTLNNTYLVNYFPGI